MTIPCEKCPTVPMCMNKEALFLIRECPYLNLHLTTQGRKAKRGQHVVVGIHPLKFRYIVTRNHKDHIHIGWLETVESEDADTWYTNYGGNKSV